jgi:hypothetical protein
MKKAIFTAVMLLAACAWAVAQDPGQKGQSTSPSQTTTIQGCLGRTDGGFTLTDKAGARYDVTGDTATLDKHVGHEVQITGTKAATSTPSSTSETATTNRTEARIDVSNVKHVAETCKSRSETQNPPKSEQQKPPMSEKPPIPPR